MNIKKIFLSLSLYTMAFSPVFALDNSQTNTTADGHVQSLSQKNGELIAYLIVLNNNEIAAAKVAHKKNVNKEVGSYAATMNKDHSKNLDETLKISKQIKQAPINTFMVDSAKQKGEQELSMLTTLDSKAFEKAYIDAMVKGHEDALFAINSSFIDIVDNDTLKKHLETTRAHIAQHLEQAKLIQQKMAD